MEYYILWGILATIGLVVILYGLFIGLIGENEEIEHPKKHVTRQELEGIMKSINREVLWNIQSTVCVDFEKKPVTVHSFNEFLDRQNVVLDYLGIEFEEVQAGVKVVKKKN